MKTITQKLVAVWLATIMGICMASAQTKTVKHTVGRGETLASIAQRYGTTNEKIIELNPDAADFIYVGMELTIPASIVSDTTRIMKSSDIQESMESSDSIRKKSNRYIEERNNQDAGFSFALEFYAGFPDVDIKGCHPFSFEGGFSVPYWIKEKDKGLFVSAGLAYASTSASYSETFAGYHSRISESHSLLAIPVKAGFAISNNDKFAITPFVGFNLGITIKGSIESNVNGNKEKKKFKSGKFAPDFRLGTFIRLWGFDVGGYFAIPITDDCKAIYGDSGYFGASIGFGY